MLCQGEVDPLWGKGYLPTLGAETGERMQRVRPDPGELKVRGDSQGADRRSGGMVED